MAPFLTSVIDCSIIVPPARNLRFESLDPSPCPAFSQTFSVNSSEANRRETASLLRPDHVTLNALAARNNEA